MESNYPPVRNFHNEYDDRCVRRRDLLPQSARDDPKQERGCHHVGLPKYADAPGGE